MDQLSIAGVLLIPLIAGVVEFCKKWGVTGRYAELLAVVLGVLLGSLWYMISQEIIPPEWLPYIGIPLFGLAFGLGIPGLYDLTFRIRRG